MDKINKALRKLSNKEREKLMAAFGRIILGDLTGLNVKKLKGHEDLYRLRVGDNRLVYRKTEGAEPVVVYVGKRDEQTYRAFSNGRLRVCRGLRA